MANIDAAETKSWEEEEKEEEAWRIPFARLFPPSEAARMREKGRIPTEANFREKGGASEARTSSGSNPSELKIR